MYKTDLGVYAQGVSPMKLRLWVEFQLDIKWHLDLKGTVTKELVALVMIFVFYKINKP